MLIVVLPCTTINSEFWQAKMSLLLSFPAIRGGIENVPRIGVTVITKTGKSSLFPIL